MSALNPPIQCPPGQYALLDQTTSWCDENCPYKCAPTVLPNGLQPPSTGRIAQSVESITSSTAGATAMPILYGDAITLQQGSNGYWGVDSSITYIDMQSSVENALQFVLLKADGTSSGSVGTPIQDGDAVYIVLLAQTPPQPPEVSNLYPTYGYQQATYAPWFYLAAMTNRDVQLYSAVDNSGMQEAPGSAVFYIRGQSSGASAPANPPAIKGGSLLYGTSLLLASSASTIGINSLGATDLYINYKDNYNGDLNVGDPSGAASLLTNSDYVVTAFNPTGVVPYWIAPPSTCSQTQSCTSSDGGVTSCIGGPGQWTCSDGSAASCASGCTCTCGGSATAQCSAGTTVYPVIAGNCVSGQCGDKGCINGNTTPSCTAAGLWDCGTETTTAPLATWKLVLAIGAVLLVAGLVVAAVVYYLRN